LVAAPQQPLRPNDRSVVVIACDAHELDRVDLDTIEALARLALAARRVGFRVRLENAPPDLRDLLALVGLADVLPCGPRSGLEAGGQAEQWKETGGVEEERDPADPAV
jgi:ABC-type transporter Mla MlaB component